MSRNRKTASVSVSPSEPLIKDTAEAFQNTADTIFESRNTLVQGLLAIADIPEWLQ
ncbi:hypothetical protein FVEN_g12885 [Fusarium venenatum]|nr:hypothetical protein FVEN_g12885 [Fusarium venenatum]